MIAKIQATTVFGNKYVSLTSPENPSAQPVTSNTLIDATSVTTEFNTVFQTLVELAQKRRPGQGEPHTQRGRAGAERVGGKFGQSIVNGNKILADLNARMPTIRHDIQQVAALADVYTTAAPDLLAALKNAVTTARTLNRHQAELDAALLAAGGFAVTGEDIFTRSKPYLIRLLADLSPTAQLLDIYSPEVFCMLRNFAELAPKVAVLESGNHYSAQLGVALAGTENPYVYPDNCRG